MDHRARPSGTLAGWSDDSTVCNLLHEPHAGLLAGAAGQVIHPDLVPAAQPRIAKPGHQRAPHVARCQRGQRLQDGIAGLAGKAVVAQSKGNKLEAAAVELLEEKIRKES